ncbi:MAG: NAD(P)-binding protein [Steroidobacteraceae bacterium]|nr:NAD(P)-binding protein [Steroidobacteraceae bacterium]
MTHRITRRDFLDGVALAVVAGTTPATLLAQSKGSSPYPPALTGWRGSTPESYAVAHAVRDGRRYSMRRMPVEERYDLIIIGAGIGGLAAAHFYLKEEPGARVLLLDNHDDFGGHARRNEFTANGRLLLSYGGSESIQSPKSEWSREALGLLSALNVDVDRFAQAFDRTLYPGLGLSRGVFFTREAFGVDRLVPGDPMRMVADDIPPDRMNARPIHEFIAGFPLADEQKKRLVSLFAESRDVLPGRSAQQKEAALASISYRDFIKRYWQLDDDAANTFQGRSHDFFAIGIDALPAYDAMQAGYPGFQGLGLRRGSNPELDDPYIYHFPDGNASIARLLVRRLIPGVAPGTSMDDIVTARFDYARLDRPDNAVRLRLESTVVSVTNGNGGKVDVGYVRDGTLHRVQAPRVIYAGYGAMLPYICPDVGRAQREALAGAVRAPFVYVKVLVRHWQPWVNQGVHEITNPMGFFSRLKLDYPVSLGDYRSPSRPDEPMVLHLVHVPTVPMTAGRDQRSAWKAARAQLYTRSFAYFEHHARDELTRMLGAGGFDAAKDILAITVNRWGHAYAYGFNSLHDPEHEFGNQLIARQPVGRIAIAGTDAARSAYAHAAIDHAYRAVSESVSRRE